MKPKVKIHDTFDHAFLRAQKRDFDISRSRRERKEKLSKITELIDYYNLDAAKQDIKDWHDARLLALDYMIPDWTDLIRVYDDVMVDAFLSGIIMTIKLKEWAMMQIL